MVTKSDLKRLKKRLRRGDYLRISNTTGYSVSYITKVLSPIDNRENMTVIEAATAIADSNDKAKEQIKEQIRKHLKA